MIDSIERFLKYMNTPIEAFLLSIALVISSIISNKAKDVDLFFFRNPYWLSFRILFCFHEFFQSVIKEFF